MDGIEKSNNKFYKINDILENKKNLKKSLIVLNFLFERLEKLEINSNEIDIFSYEIENMTIYILNEIELLEENLKEIKEMV